MYDILHHISIKASAEQVYDAITTQKGLRSWWTADSEAEPRVGSIAQFGFHNRAVVFRMEVDELIPATRVHWKCAEGPEEWVGTELSFDLTEDEEGSTQVMFSHTAWRATDGDYPLCNTTWGHLMYVLRSYVEGGNPGPHFKD